MERSGSADNVSASVDETKPSRLHSILINHVDDDDFFKNHQMRPRANTDPVSPRPRLRVTFDLPDIVVDDCSDNDENNLDFSRPEEINKQLTNTDEGAFFVFTSPPRQRSNTCPMNMFSKQKPRRVRPPTPPPMEKISPEMPRYPSWDKVSFSPHSLTSVEETRETARETTRETICDVTRDSEHSQDKKLVGTKTETHARSRKCTHIRTTTKTKQKGSYDSPSSSPKRAVPKMPNGHVTPKSGGHAHHVIHSTA